MLSSGGELSVASKFTGRKEHFLVLNRVGSSRTKWSDAVIFVIAKKGLVYGDPDMTSNEHIDYDKDAVKLKYAAISEYLEDKNNFIEVPGIPVKPQLKSGDYSKRASNLIARDILQSHELEDLAKHLN